MSTGTSKPEKKHTILLLLTFCSPAQDKNCPKDPDPSKVVILRTKTPLRTAGSFTLPLEGQIDPYGNY